MSDAQYRPPTVKEGADFIEKCFEREYKLSCIAFWRKHYGDTLAEGIMNELRSRKKNKSDLKDQQGE